MSARPHYNVLIAPEWYPWPERPGLGVWVREQARALAGHHRVVVMACTPDESVSGRYSITEGLEDGLRVLRVRHRPGAISQIGFAHRVAGMLAALARLREGGFEPNVVHAHVFSAGLPSLLLGRRTGAPVVVSEHYSGIGLGLLGRWDRLIARVAYSRANVVCPVSAQLAGHVRALAPGARIRIAPNPVDTDVFHPPGTPIPHADGAALGVNVGSLVEQKGHEELLRALALARQGGSNIRLEIVGDGPLRRSLESLAQELEVHDSVSFCGALTRDALAARMRAAHFFVLPSHWENAPVALLEALASGLPALASRVGGIPDIVGEDAGVLVAAGDVEGLASGLADLAASRDRFDRARLAEEARSRYGFDAVRSAWEEIYGEALG